MNNFPYAIKEVLKSEGGYVNNPADKGGPTNFGITQKTLSQFYPALDVKNLTRELAEKIYEAEYWKKNSLDKIIDPENAHIALDTVVLHGDTGGGKLIQLALNTLGVNVKPDGIVGSATIAAINTQPPKNFQQALYALRKSWYETKAKSDPSQQVFLKGWLKRISKWNTGIALGGSLAGLAIAAAAVYFFFFRKSKD